MDRRCACWRLPLAHGAGVNIEVRGVDDELRDNVLAYLSFERYKKGGAELTSDTVERLHNRVEREVQAALRPFGYYEPQGRFDGQRPGHGDWRVVIDITPGPPVLVQHIDVHVDGPGETDPLFQRILHHLPLHPGDRLNHAYYEALKTDLQRTAATYGYLDAKMIRNELVVDPAQHTANVALELDTGQRYHFGVTTIQQHVVNDKLVRRYLRYHEGDPFDLTQVLRTQFALDDAQYFANLEVLPGEPDRQALQRAGQHPRATPAAATATRSASATPPTPACAARSASRTATSTSTATTSASRCRPRR